MSKLSTLSGKRVRYAIIFSVILTSILFQFRITPPVSNQYGEPAGWASSLPTRDLSGMISLSNRDSYNITPNPLFYSRIIAYASSAYWDAARSNNFSDSIIHSSSIGEPEREAGVQAFAIVMKALYGNNQVSSIFDSYIGNNPRAEDVARKTIQRASLDGYSTLPMERIKAISALKLDIDSVDFTWRPFFGEGAEIEPLWGSLSPILFAGCKVGPPPVKSITDLRVAAKRAATVVQSAGSDGRVISLANQYFGVMDGGGGARSWLGYSIDHMSDLGLSSYESDKLLTFLAISSHDLLISTWSEKYYWLLAHPTLFEGVDALSRWPVFPSYPSESAAVANNFALLIEFSIGTFPFRLETPGTMFSNPTTRVLPNVLEAAREAAEISYAVGSGYDFDIPAGEQMANCIIKQVVAHPIFSIKKGS
jgi:hypothetical protein